MKSKFTKITATLLLLFGLHTTALAQKTLNSRINSSFDDLEEWVAGPPTQSNDVGDIDWNSSDLEFGYESGTADPQLLGLRFTNISIPRGSLITAAYIQFTVDATSKNTDPCKVIIRIDPSDHSLALDSNKFHLTNRSKSADSVVWNVSDKTKWAVVGAAGADQRTADLSSLLQQIVNRNGWQSGNAVTFFLNGTGTREVESYDGDASKAPLLVVEYIPAVTVGIRINNELDDLEEWIAGPPTQNKDVGEIDWNSSDLEFGYESSTADPQLVGLRFNGIQIPKGSLILNSYIQFTVDATSKNADPCEVVIRYEPADNAAALDSNKFHLTNLPKSADSVLWKVSDKSKWGVVGAAGVDQQSADISSMVQSLVNRSGWNPGNSMVFFLKGTGTREVESFDGDAARAPQLVITYIPLISKSVRINNAFDDLEEWIAGPPTQNKDIGEIDWNSSDLEFGYESSTADPQLVGLRFNQIDVPKGAIVKNSYIQFTVDATSKNADPCEVVIRCEPADHAAPLDSNKYHLSNRNKSADSVLWSVSAKSNWGVVGAAGPDQRTADLSPLIQKIINRPGWSAKNSMAFFLKGTGTREVESFDGDAPKAPLLVIEYLGSSDSSGNQTSFSAIPVTGFPLLSGQKWYYWDKGTTPSASWKDTLNNDTLWGQGAAPLGYGDAHIKTPVGFGGNASSKYITTWFRKVIQVPSVSTLSDTLELNLMYDDGAVIFCNGTEILRVNMPSGTLDSSVLSVNTKDGLQEQLFYSFDVPKTILRDGKNVISAEIHQRSAGSSDIGFDMELKNRSMRIPTTRQLCTGSSDVHITCFESVLPIDHADSMTLPLSHTFQRIFAQGDAYTVGGGTAKGNNDFTGFIPKNGSSTEGWLSINHETNPGGVSILDLHFDCKTGLWVVDSSRAVDFSTDIVLTASNCSGGVTPWGTVVTCEETTGGGDVNSDGYNDLGWMVEIDPVTKKVMKYGTSKYQKLWAMGRMSHENVCFKNDSITSYYGEDAGSGNVWKFVADKKTDLSAGKLYVLKLDSGMNGYEPKSSTGQWILIPNTTQSERNNIRTAAAAIGATAFSGVEDVEINPLNGDVYFTAKGNSRTYRFADNGNTISGFETYAGGRSYRINTAEGIISEPWGSGNDNLTFDSRGNLYVLQDGGKDHIWVLKNGHSQANPKVEVFMTTPLGSEPTGMTFTPDEKFMFLSIQSPSSTNTTIQKDAAGTQVVFNKATTLVVAMDDAFQPSAKSAFSVNDSTQCISGNSFAFTNLSGSRSIPFWNFGNGQTGQQHNPVISYTAASNPLVTLKVQDMYNGCSSTATKTLVVYPKPLAQTLTGYTQAVQGSSQPYSAISRSGSVYSWTIGGGTQTSGGNTASIQVLWGSGTSGTVQVTETDKNGCTGDPARIQVMLKTSGNEEVAFPGLNVYPNPVLDIVHINAPSELKWSLTDANGRWISEGLFLAATSNEIDMSQLAPGIYRLTVSDGTASRSIQLIKNK